MKQIQNRDQSQTITPKQKKYFVIITLSIPFLFLILLELGLRQFNYGPDLSLFSVENANGNSYYTLNPTVKNRYFSQVDFNPGASPERFLVTKSSGTFRIFCLGGSTTVGYPYWYNGAFSSFLRDRLKTIFPSHNIEVINVGMTATNSYTVLDMSKELMSYQPDLLIVYDGHNEFYGALGVASNEHGTTARWMTQLYLRLIHVRTFQLVNNIISEIRTMFGATPIDYSKHTTMMEQVARGKNVPYGCETYVKGLSIFQQNLEELAILCRDQHVPLFLSTQVSNIRDQSPFISNNSPNISQQQQAQFQLMYSNGVELQSKGAIDSAIALFRSAIAIDSLYADAHYQLAQCLDIKEKNIEAYPEYILARDYDELRFRTDTKFNDLIRSMEDHQHCFVADIETIFKQHSQDSLIGNNLILEHLHPTAQGHFFIAKEYVRLMRNHELLASLKEWTRQDMVSDNFLWEHRPLTKIDELLAARKTEYLTSSWPFKSQSLIIIPAEKTDTLQFIVDHAVHNEIGWETAHKRAVEYYQRRGDFFNTIKEYETIINQFSLDVTSYLSLAQIYFEQKYFFEAESVLLASLRIKQTSAAYRALGDICMKQGRTEKAVYYYIELTKFPEDAATSAENAYMLAFAFLLSGKTDQAIYNLELTVNRFPGYKPAVELLTKAKLYKQSHPVK